MDLNSCRFSVYDLPKTEFWQVYARNGYRTNTETAATCCVAVFQFFCFKVYIFYIYDIIIKLWKKIR